MTDYDLLEKLTKAKMSVDERVEYELDLIRTGPPFIATSFLKAYQYVVLNEHAAQNINECHSIIAYNLGITKAHPGKISFHYPVEPGALPDIDTDFAYPDQVKEYIREKYGSNRVIGIPTYGRYKFRALLTDLCRVVTDEDGERYVSIEDVKAFNKKLPFKLDQQVSSDMADEDDNENDDELFSNPDIQQFQKRYPKIFEHFSRLYATPKYRGRHAAGVAILPEEARSTLPLSMLSGNVCAEWTEGQGVSELGSIGVIKLDILGLKTLKILDTTNHLIMERFNIDENTPWPCACKRQGVKCPTNSKMPMLSRKNERLIDFNRVCMNVPKVYRSISDGATQGVFQFEPEGITKFTKKYGPKRFYDLALITSLYRPGPLDAKLDKLGMPIDPDDPAWKSAPSAAHAFIERYNGREKVYYASPKLEDVLGESYGVAVFQEDISQIIMKMTKCNFNEAEKVRKFLTKVKPEALKSDPDKIAELKKYEDKFTKQSLANGCTPEEIQGVWNLIVPFSRYGFNKCISGDTIVVRSSGNQFCKKEVTVAELYKAQESKTSIGKKMRLYGIQIMQMSLDGQIRPGKMKKIYNSGIQPVFKITTASGKNIKVTANHRLLTFDGYKQISEIKIGEKLIVQGGNVSTYAAQTYVSVVKQPKTANHWNLDSSNGQYIDGRAVAYRTSTTQLPENICQNCGKENNIVKKHDFEIAHIKSFADCGYNWSVYNGFENLKKLCNSCHKTLDYQKGERKVRFTHGKQAIEDMVVSISYIGKEQTYDIEMNTVEHNFIANGIVSHNSHAVAYSMISFQTAFCRTQFPIEFLTALMIHNVDKTDKLVEYVRAAQKMDIKILPPDLNTSDISFKITENGEILAGFTVFKGIGDKAADEIINNRAANGPFTSVDDFLSRDIQWRRLDVGDLQVLVKGGTFDQFNKNRAQVLAQILLHKKKVKKFEDLKEFDLVQTTKEFDVFAEPGETPKHQIDIESIQEWPKNVAENNFREAFGFLLEDYLTKNKDKVAQAHKVIHDIVKQSKKDATVGVVQEIKVLVQKDGKKYARITATNMDGIKEQWLLFASVWDVFKNDIKPYYTYVCIGKKDDKGTFLMDSVKDMEDYLK